MALKEFAVLLPVARKVYQRILDFLKGLYDGAAVFFFSDECLRFADLKARPDTGIKYGYRGDGR